MTDYLGLAAHDLSSANSCSSHQSAEGKLAVEKGIQLGHSDEIGPLRVPTALVQVLRIPSEVGRLELCRAARVPRLLYLEGNVVAPHSTDPLEDWVRPPIRNADLDVRMKRLRALAVVHMTPSIDADGVVQFGANGVALTPVETILMCCLIGSYRSTVRRDVLQRVVWSDSPGVRRNALDVHILRLRRRLAQIGLGLRTIWGVGYVLEPILGAFDLGLAAAQDPELRRPADTPGLPAPMPEFRAGEGA